MLYCSRDIVQDGCNFYFSFWAIFCPFTPLTAQKIKIKKKMQKRPEDIILLHIGSPGAQQVNFQAFFNSLLSCSFFFFNWDSLHARLNSHYEAWS